MINETDLLDDPGADLAPATSRRRRGRLPWGALTIIGIATLAAIFAPLVSPHDPYKPNLVKRLQPPGGEFLLGSDTLGRDLLSRLIYGARTTLIVVVAALVVGAAVGLLVGMVAGYRGRTTDTIISRLIDGVLAFPSIFFGLLLAVTLQPGMRSVIIAVAIVLWARFARVMRAEVVNLKDRDYISQARIIGCSGPRILSVHLLPNVVATFMVLVTLNMGYVVMLEASLSFLGAGISPPTPSWGAMISEGQPYIGRAWWLSAVPGVAIMLLVLAFNLLGDWLRDRFDPRLQSSR